MTEAEWFAEADWRVLHKRVPQRENCARKIRLFCVACCRRIARLFKNPACDEAVAGVELFADGEATAKRLHKAAQAAYATITLGPPYARNWARGAAWRTARAEEFWEGATACITAVSYTAANLLAEVQAQTVLFRDIFRPLSRRLKCERSWLTSDVLALAQGIYADRAFDRMPILADALQDAGCNSEHILNHCRDTNQVHVRGCWVVDLVLGKE